MSKAKNKISQQDWINLHPWKTQVDSDTYYITLSNVFIDIADNVFKKEISKKAKRTIALSVAAYFEDVISGFGLWQGFIRKHFTMYGKYLPFYIITDDYVPGKINPEDVLFIIWSIIQLETGTARDSIINPENIAIVTLGMTLFTILDKEYEIAPKNEMIKDYFTKAVNYNDFFAFRTAISWLYYQSYLMVPYTKEHLAQALEGIEKHEKHENVLIYSIINELIFKNPCGPLALKTYEWFAAIVGEDTGLGKMLLQIRSGHKLAKSYLIMDKNEMGATLLPFDNDEPVFLSNDSLEKEMPLKTGNAVFCNLVYYNRKWNLNGFMMSIPVKEYDKAREEARKVKHNVKRTMDLFLETSKNQPVRYFKNGKDARQFLSTIGSSKGKLYDSLFEVQKNIIITVNPEYGITIMTDIAQYINDKDNPCYNEEKAKKEGISLIVKYELFRELIEHFVKNNLITDLKLNSLRGEEHGKKLIQDNLDFMFRFFQPFSFKD